MPLLRIRKVADKSVEHVTVNDPQTGRTVYVNTQTGQSVQSKPLLGVQPEGDLPEECSVSVSFVQRAIAEGWAHADNERVVYRPSGPAHDKWNAAYPPHTFVHADAIVFHFLTGDVRYRVVHQPDKYVAGEKIEYKGELIHTYPDFSLDSEPVTDEHYNAGNTRVDWFYGLKLEK